MCEGRNNHAAHQQLQQHKQRRQHHSTQQLQPQQNVSSPLSPAAPLHEAQQPTLCSQGTVSLLLLLLLRRTVNPTQKESYWHKPWVLRLGEAQPAGTTHNVGSNTTSSTSSGCVGTYHNFVIADADPSLYGSVQAHIAARIRVSKEHWCVHNKTPTHVRFILG